MGRGKLAFKPMIFFSFVSENPPIAGSRPLKIHYCHTWSILKSLANHLHLFRPFIPSLPVHPPSCLGQPPLHTHNLICWDSAKFWTQHFFCKTFFTWNVFRLNIFLTQHFFDPTIFFIKYLIRQKRIWNQIVWTRHFFRHNIFRTQTFFRPIICLDSTIFWNQPLFRLNNFGTHK